MRHGIESLAWRRKGFSLVEASIVLAILGVILGTVFSVAHAAWVGTRIVRTKGQIFEVVQNIREHYMSMGGMPGMCNTNDITAALDSLGIFPSEMRSGSGAINSALVSAAGPSGGSGAFRVKATAASCSGTVNPLGARFRIILTNLPREVCVQMLFSGVNFKDHAFGVTALCGAPEVASAAHCYVGTAANWFNISCDQETGVCDATTPLTLAQARNLCTHNNATTGQVGWEFKVRN